MADDCRFSTAFPHHPKTVKLIRRLQEAAAWAWVCLLLWVADNRPDGNLTGLSGEDLEIAAGWNGESGTLISTLVDVRFLDGEPGAYTVHDWAEHNPYVASRPQRIEASRLAGEARWKGVSPEERSEAARQAINARWDRKRQAADTSDIPADRSNDTSGYERDTSGYEPPPLPPLPTQPKKSKTKTKAHSFAVPSWIPTEAWVGFCEMRKGLRKPFTDRAARLIVEKLEKLRSQGEDVGQVLDQSVRSGWQDVFPLRRERPNGKANGQPDDVDYDRDLGPQNPDGSHSF